MKIYLAGPEVFLPNAISVLNGMAQQVRKAGHDPLIPIDQKIPNDLTALKASNWIFQKNVVLIDQCDAIIANCNYFRTATVDDGTSWELGYGFARKKQLWGYMNKILPLPQLVAEFLPNLDNHTSGYKVDPNGFLINEDFGNAINLMLQSSIESSGGKLVQGNLADVLEVLK